MRGPTYSDADLLALKESPIVKKPDGLPSISQWMDVPADQNTNNGHANNGTMNDSVAQDLGNMKLEEKTDYDKMPTPRAELEITIQGLVARGNHLNNEVETYIAAVLEKQKVGKVYNPVEYVQSSCYPR
jgi:hypothetical protein